MLRVLDAFEVAQAMRGQTVGARAVAQEGNVAKRSLAVDLAVRGRMGYGAQHPTVGVRSLEDRHDDSRATGADLRAQDASFPCADFCNDSKESAKGSEVVAGQGLFWFARTVLPE